MGDTIGISQASMSRCVSNVTRALVEKAPQFITFNRDPSSREQSFHEFQRVAGFPGVLGVLDCVQVAIKAPNSEDSSYVNKKGFHSVGCQLVCNAQGLLLSAETHWPGGLKDADVLERSALCKQLQDTEEGWLLGETRILEVKSEKVQQMLQRSFCLLGDRRYPLKKWLMTPVNCPESPAEFQYNVAHTATHEIVDRAFRAIQTRFKCLDGTKGYLQVCYSILLDSVCFLLELKPLSVKKKRNINVVVIHPPLCAVFSREEFVHPAGLLCSPQCLPAVWIRRLDSGED
uniref:Putative nuclease HARBI1 n=1 Tax=Monopterus albus TaxID=43700 RepID=A0A3Q3K9V7_MONAL